MEEREEAGGNHRGDDNPARSPAALLAGLAERFIVYLHSVFGEAVKSAELVSVGISQVSEII
jgi:hypothetical protein